MQGIKRLGLFATLGLLMLGLAACGDKEPEQRKAFIDFLQTRIIDKPGVHLAQPSSTETDSFGDYAKQYAVITDFNKGMDESVAGKMQGALAAGAIRSLGDLVSRRNDLDNARATFRQMSTALDADLAAADAAHAQLKQPDDLRAVYDKAYDRLVTGPAKAFREIIPTADAVMSTGLKLSDYLAQHQAQIKISGSTIQVSDAKIQGELNTLVQGLNAQAQGIAVAQNKLRSVMYGTAN